MLERGRKIKEKRRNALCVGKVGDKHVVQRKKEIPSAYRLRGDICVRDRKIYSTYYYYLREAMHMMENLRA